MIQRAFPILAFVLMVSNAVGAPSTFAASPGKVVAWGDDDAGQTKVPSGPDSVVAVAGATSASLALNSDGTVVAWGDQTPGFNPAVTLVPAGLSGVTAISANNTNAMALQSDGTVVRWGAQWCSCVSSPPSPLTGVHAIAAGWGFEVVAFNNGTVGAWGSNYVGETNVPAGLSGVIAVSAGNNHALALKNDGTVVAWGYDNGGQADVPAGLSGVVAISARGGHSLALKSDGTVVAWGSNVYGESSVPSGLIGVVAIAAGAQNSVALKSDGTIVMWGNTYNGTNVVPAGLPRVSGIASGDFFTLAIVATDTTPPTTTASLSGQQGSNGWYVGPVSISLSVTDNPAGSGIASTVYSVDGGPTQTYTGAFTVGSDGKHSVSFHSTDVAGNVEANETTTFQIDQAPPASSATVVGTSGNNGWYVTPVSVALAASDSGSGVARTYYAVDTTACALSTPAGCSTYSGSPFTVGADGTHSLTYFSQDVAGNIEAVRTQTLQIDSTPPTIKCGSTDGQWHATDVSLACTAGDANSGLANSADASFSLSTSVPVGAETNDASTSTRTVSDMAGNSTTAGPIGGNMVDKKPPTITVNAPVAGTYLLRQAVTASYSCTDGGASVATCAGTVPTGSNVDTSSVGAKTFVVNATDKVGNAASPQTVTYQVAYALPSACILYDQTKAVQSGSVVPIKFQLCDTNAADVSSANITVSAQKLTQVSTQAPGTLESVGSANPDNNFRFDSTLGPTGGYIYNLSTSGLATGTYAMTFIATGDPTQHQV